MEGTLDRESKVLCAGPSSAARPETLAPPLGVGAGEPRAPSPSSPDAHHLLGVVALSRSCLSADELLTAL